MKFHAKIIIVSFCSLAATGFSQKPELNRKVVGSIGNAEMNVLYVGYKNKVRGSASGMTQSAKVSCEGCASIEQSEEEGVYFVKVNTPGKKVTISITDDNLKGSKDAVGTSQNFRVLGLPKPRVFVVGTDPFDSRISKSVLADGYLTCQFIGTPTNVVSKVVGALVTISIGGVSKSFKMTGNKISEEIGSVIKELKTATTVIIEPSLLIDGSPISSAPLMYIIK